MDTAGNGDRTRDARVVGLCEIPCSGKVQFGGRSGKAGQCRERGDDDLFHASIISFCHAKSKWEVFFRNFVVALWCHEVYNSVKKCQK